MFLTCRNKTPLVFTMLESENNEKMIEIIKKYITPNTIKGNTIGYLPIMRKTGGGNNVGFLFVGVKPVNWYEYKTKQVLGHFPEYGETSLKSDYPHTRCFTSNKDLALKYYKHCAISLNKKEILVNLSQELFLNCMIHDNMLKNCGKFIPKSTTKTTTPVLFFNNNERKRNKNFRYFVQFCKKELQRNS